MLKNQNFILLCAFRYSLHRRTYAPSVVCEELLNNWESLDNVKDNIYKEIKQEYNSLDYINRKIWNDFLIKYEAETK